MQLKHLFEEDDAVSPVIGVILMVAITVILAAVIASFVLGLGDTADQVQPTSSMSFNYDDGDHNFTVNIADGDSINGENLYIRGSLNDSDGAGNSGEVDVDVTWENAVDAPFATGTHDGFNAMGTGGYSGSDEISSGQGIEITTVDSGGAALDEGVAPYDIDVVWDTGDDSATLDSVSRD
jgi:flagellin-like protein